MNNKTLLQIALWPFGVLILHIIAMMVGWYEMFWWFDIPLHLLGGAAVVATGSTVMKEFAAEGKISINWKPLNILILLGFAALATVCWEFMEYAFDLFFQTELQPGLIDTIKDICMGLIGGGVIAIISTYTSKK